MWLVDICRVKWSGMESSIPEGLYQSRKKSERLDPENLFINPEQTGMQFGKEFRGLCQKRFTNVINGQIRDREKRKNVQRWERGARTSVFRSGLRRITDAARRGTTYTPAFDLGAMDG